MRKVIRVESCPSCNASRGDSHAAGCDWQAPRYKPHRSFMGWVMITKEDVTQYEKNALALGPCRTSAEVFNLLKHRILSEGVERMYVVMLDGRNHCMGLAEVARGGLHGCAVRAVDILRYAVMAHASAIVLVHNHPSGDPTPSVEDVTMTRAVAEAGATLGIPLVDHVVIGSLTKYVSLLDLGALEF